MDERDRDRSFAHRRCHALDVARRARRRPRTLPGRLVSSRCGGRVSGQCAAVRSSADRSGPVLMNPFASSATQPSSQRVFGIGAGHDEDVTDVVGLDRRRSRLLRQRTRSRCVVLPSSADDLGVRVAARSQDCPRCGGSGSATCVSARPLDAHQHVHAPRRLRQEHRRLAGGVAAADHDHFFAAAQLRLHERRAVVDAGAFELRQVLDRRPPVFARRSR